MFQIVRHRFNLEVIFRPLRPRKRRRARRLNFHQQFEQRQFQQLESRDMLFGFMQAQDEGPFKVLNTVAYNVSAPGVLSGVTGGDAPYTAHLAAQAGHGTVTVNADGSWSYTANAGFVGQDSFQYDATDTNDDASNQATVTLSVGCGVLSDVDQTKLPADTMRLPMQILGSSSGQPATAGNLSLVYNSSTAQPTQILEQDFQPSMSPAASTELGMSATFNGTQDSATFVSTSNLTQSNPIIRLSSRSILPAFPPAATPTRRPFPPRRRWGPARNSARSTARRTR